MRWRDEGRDHPSSCFDHCCLKTSSPFCLSIQLHKDHDSFLKTKALCKLSSSSNTAPSLLSELVLSLKRCIVPAIRLDSYSVYRIYSLLCRLCKYSLFYGTHSPHCPHLICVFLSLHRFLPEKGLFILESEPLKRCISVDRSNLVLEDCERPTRRMLWKWVSRHRLFNLGTSTCLGLNISDATQPLGMFECDTALPVLWWRCSGNMLYGASQWRVTAAGRLVVVKKNIYHGWKRYNTPREGPCSYPYEGKAFKNLVCLHKSSLNKTKYFTTPSHTRHVLSTDIHTLLGSAHGMPCAFPFKYNNKWYSECTTEGREDQLLWCSTSIRYDKAERWGFCPVQGKVGTQAHQ